MRYVWLPLIVVLLMVSPATAQITYPGYTWTSAGTVTPSEAGNKISLSYLEQGIAYKGFSIIALSTLGADSQGNNWNNYLCGGLGGRLTQTFANIGTFRFTAAYLKERRWVSNQHYSGLSLSVDFYQGWKGGKN